jgi:hypothetical protein
MTVDNLLARILKFRYKHRKHKRYKTREGLTVILDQKATKGDEIIDIGMGGLTFNYVDMGEPLKEKFEIDIHVDGELIIEKAKVKLVSNIEVGDISFQGKNIRRISVQFLSLTPVQEFDLRALIKSHALE